MNKIIFLICFLSVFSVKGQTVSGRIVNQINEGLAYLDLQLFCGTDIFTAATDSSGYFSFYNVTDIKDGTIPTGYSISNNYPNPFNPLTRFTITCPQPGQIEIEVFNVIGRRVSGVTNRNLYAGINYVDLDFDGLANGLYIVRFLINEKYSDVRKVMLLYGSQHLSKSTKSLNYMAPKITATVIDSLVANGLFQGRKSFTDLPLMESGVLDLGNLEIDMSCPEFPSIEYQGKVYNTVLIGEQCWLKENIDVGSRIDGSDEQDNPHLIEKYCYDDDPENCLKYGGLYQWDQAMQYSKSLGSRGICPEGWHIPRETDIYTLRQYVSNDGNSMKAVGVGLRDGEGTNISGFSALLSGYRLSTGNGFGYKLIYTRFWTSFEHSETSAVIFGLRADDSDIELYMYYKNTGYSVRCIKTDYYN